MNEEKYCKCGCGQKIIIKPRHAIVGVPDYLPKHWNKISYQEDVRKKTKLKLQILKESLKGA